MPHRSKAFAAVFALAAAAIAARGIAAQQSAQGLTGSQQPARDTPAQQTSTPPPPAGHISGRVLAADNGRPVKRARVFINAAELPGGRGVLTDDLGVFDLTDLPAGRYTMTVSKSGFVSLAYGQRRPLQAGTPLQLADGQELKGIEFRLPRGSVVAGHVTDEDGDPMPGVQVRVMRYEYQQGDRQLVAAGTSQTDDRGEYRVWGLMPGDYYVNAQARLNLNLGTPAGRGGRGGPAGGVPAAIAGAIGRIGGPQIAALLGQGDDDQKAYAPTYFPGVTSVAEARPITLGLSQESLDNDFGLQLIHVAKIAGKVTTPDGSPSTSGQISLLPDSGVDRGQLTVNFQSRINWDGAFSFSNVTPGRYVLRARGNDTAQPQFASVPLTIGGSDISDLSVILSAGASISGTVVFPPGQGPVPDVTNVRITAPSTEQQVGNQSQARVEKDGTFSIDGLPAGPHLIRPNGGLRGWTLRSVTVDGRDVTDVSVDLRSGQKLSNVTITFTDRVNEINGTMTSDRGVPVTEYTVLAFSTDPSFWRPQSRQIATARPDQNGKFTIRTLPPGDYYLVTVDPTEQGEWFEPAYLEEHRVGASRVTLGDGDTKTHDFTIRTP